MLGADPKAVDARLFATASLDRYLSFMDRTLSRLRGTLREDGFMCLVVGDVQRPSGELNLAREVVKRCESDLELIGVVTDRIPVQHKVTRIWKGSKGQATKTDQIIVLAGPKAAKPRRLEPIRWVRQP